MFNPVLIHSNNTTVIDCFDSSLPLRHDIISDIDSYITEEFIPKNIIPARFNILFIKESLSPDFLGLFGCLLACHIRLSENLGDKRFMPIVILSDFDGFILNKMNPIANILFTKGVYICKESIQSVEYFEQKFNDGQLATLTKSDYRSYFLEKIVIPPPAHYLSHHGITNDWSLNQWSKAVGIKNDKIDSYITNSLYFKYLTHLHPPQKLSLEKKYHFGSGKIMFIDDEWEKGWSAIFETIFTNNIKFSAYNRTFKGEEREEILSNIIKTIIEYDPDVIFLDLRLHDSDFGQKIDELSGVMLLREIKTINPGIQVIVFTASNKGLILEKLHDIGICGYLKKDTPSQSAGNVNNNINKLRKLTSKALTNKYLKQYWCSVQIMKKIMANQPFCKYFNSTDSEQQILFMKYLESGFHLLQTSNDDRFDLCMLLQFKCFEILTKIAFKEKDNKQEILYFWDGEKTKYWKYNKTTHRYESKSKDPSIEKSGYESTGHKLHALILQKLDIHTPTFHENISKFCRYRNDYIHSAVKKRIESNDINVRMKILCKILEAINNK